MEEIPSIAKNAELLGFNTLWILEIKHDPFIALSAASQHTSRIGLGTGIALAFPRNPMTLAYSCWSLEQLSHGRFILGLGSQVKGNKERRFGITWASPVPRMREIIHALRHIWNSWQTGQSLDFQGQFHKLDLMTPFFNPGPVPNPNIPILIAAVNKRMCQLADEVADGIIVHPLHTREYLKETIVPHLRRGIERAGRRMGDIAVVVNTFIATGNDKASIERAKEAIRTQVAFYASTRTHRVVIESPNWGDVSLKLHSMSLKGEWQAMSSEVTDEMLDEFMIEGTYEEILQRLKRKYAQLANRVIINIPIPPSDSRWRSVLSHFT